MSLFLSPSLEIYVAFVLVGKNWISLSEYLCIVESRLLRFQLEIARILYNVSQTQIKTTFCTLRRKDKETIETVT